MEYKITTPEEGYTGIIAGVSFANGEGETENNWLADWFTEKGYGVAEIAEGEIKEETINLSKLSVKELKDLAKEKGIQGYSSLGKEELIKALEE
jgi:hypothetical protein